GREHNWMVAVRAWGPSPARSNPEEAMSVASRLGLLLVAAGVCLALYEWDLVKTSPRDSTQAALRQFDNSDAAAEELRVAGAARHWWLLGGACGLALLAACLFGEDAARWWRRDAAGPRAQEPR